jgi:hypothetical protein
MSDTIGHNDQTPASRITKLPQNQENTAKILLNEHLLVFTDYKRALHRLSVEEQLFPLVHKPENCRRDGGGGEGGKGYNKNNYSGLNVGNYTHLYSLS